MSNVEDYVVVLNTLINQKKSVIGDLAVEKARTVKAIIIDDNGVVISIASDPQEALSKLMSVYKHMLGDSAE